MFLCLHQCETSKRPVILGCLVFSLHYFTTHTPSHVSSEFSTFMYPLATQCRRCGPLVLHTLQPWWKSLRKSFVIHLFEWSTVWCSLLVLKISYSTTVSTHKSWPFWLWRQNPSPPPPFWRLFRRKDSRTKWSVEVDWNKNRNIKKVNLLHFLWHRLPQTPDSHDID